MCDYNVKIYKFLFVTVIFMGKCITGIKAVWEVSSAKNGRYFFMCIYKIINKGSEKEFM